MIEGKECYVVLGHLMCSSGELDIESKERVDKLVDHIKNKKNQFIFFCGWDYREDSNIKLAKALNDYFLKCNNHPHYFFQSDCSRDTVGDAVLLKYKYDNVIKNMKINVFTTDYHKKRSKEIFEFIFNNNNIEVHSSQTKSSVDTKKHEIESLNAFKKNFKGIESGNIKKIYQTLITSHPYYNGKVYSKLD